SGDGAVQAQNHAVAAGSGLNDATARALTIRAAIAAVRRTAAKRGEPIVVTRPSPGPPDSDRAVRECARWNPARDARSATGGGSAADRRRAATGETADSPGARRVCPSTC